MREAAVQLDDGARVLGWSRALGAMRLLGAGALVGGAYYAAARIGFALSFPGPPSIVVLWPPTAILLAVVLLTPPRRWWIWLVAAITANVAAHLPLSIPVWRLAHMSANNVLVALIAAGILRRHTSGRSPLTSFGGTLRFLAAVAAATLALPLVSAAVYVAMGAMSSFIDTWRLIAFANTLACLTLLPAIMLTAQHWRAWLRQATPRRAAEAAALAALLLIAGQVIFGVLPGGPLSGPLIRIVILPLLLWAVVRFGPGGLSLALSALVLVAAWNMSLGHGPFTRAAPLQNVFNLQTEFLAFAAPLLLFAALMVERRQAEADLKQLNAQLESRVDARTEELAQINAQLAVTSGQAEAANRAKSDFLATMSHELRTPLHTIMGYNRLLLNSPGLAPRQREQAHVVQRGADHLLTLINNVLDLSKIEAGQTPLQTSTANLPRMLDSLVEMFRLQAERKGIRLRCLVAPDIPRHIAVDTVKLRQVLINLVGNAVKFTQAGGVILTIRCERPEAAASPAATLVFEVADTGPGLTLDEQRQMFDAFVQTGAGQRLGEGSGLGLTISRQFVRLMGGELSVRSTIGHGTVFEGHIPVHVVRASAPREEQPASALTLAPGQPAPRVLVVDDHDDNRLLLLSLLSSLGIAARGARDGEEALATWLVWQPRFIFLDLRLPRRNGLEVARDIRATTHVAPPTIIALSASGMDADRPAAIEAGCNGFIRKPFQDAEIVEALRHYLGVQFVAAGAPTLRPPLPVAETLDPAALAALPDELLATLERVSVEGQPRRIAAAITAVRRRAPALAAPLQALADRVAFDVILDAVRAARALRGDHVDA